MRTTNATNKDFFFQGVATKIAVHDKLKIKLEKTKLLESPL